MSDGAHQITELVSMILTWPTVILSFSVVMIWVPVAWRGVRQLGWRSLTRLKKDNREAAASVFLAVGITVGFLGGLLDNSYWSIPWSLSSVGHPHEMAWNQFGPLPNIFTRQLCGMIAAYCHIRAAMLSVDLTHRQSRVRISALHALVAGGLALGVAYAIALMSFTVR